MVGRWWEKRSQSSKGDGQALETWRGSQLGLSGGFFHLSSSDDQSKHSFHFHFIDGPDRDDARSGGGGSCGSVEPV